MEKVPSIGKEPFNNVVEVLVMADVEIKFTRLAKIISSTLPDALEYVIIHSYPYTPLGLLDTEAIDPPVKP